MENVPKIPYFFCELCDYKTSNKKDYKKHATTSKHLKNTEGYKKDITIKSEKSLNFADSFCSCGKQYKYYSGLWRHKKKCSEKQCPAATDNSSNQIEVMASMFKEVMKSNQDLQQQLFELVKEKGNTTHTNSHNTTNNNNFNLNFFLNEKCKDAMNITDFIKSLEISFEDFENVGLLGYAEGISKILIDNLKNTEVIKRPMHCSDVKRETMYIKDKDIWENDKENTLFISAIKGVAHKNFMKSVDWKKENPDYRDSSSKKMDIYTKILYENSGPETKEEREKEYSKILRKVSKEVAIDKNTLS